MIGRYDEIFLPSESTENSFWMDPIVRLTKDLKAASVDLGQDEARFLVDEYYTFQKQRIRHGNQIRAMTETREGAGLPPEPNSIIGWLEENAKILERDIRTSLQVYAWNHPAGEWALAQHGVGPVIAAGLLAHVDVDKGKSPSSLWRFAGLDPTVEWKKGKKRPWNAALKQVAFHAGECFKRTSHSDKTFYGRFYRQRKEYEVRRNDAGENAELAAETLEKFNFSKTTDAYRHYKSGKLPPGRLDLRATRYATKIFLSHFWVVLYETTKKKPAPRHSYVVESTRPEHAMHTKLIEIPGYERLEAA